MQNLDRRPLTGAGPRAGLREVNSSRPDPEALDPEALDPEGLRVEIPE